MTFDYSKVTHANNTSAGAIAKNLDAADGKADGKINASIWNDFVNDKGGKKIKNYITVDNAINSITTYLVREEKGNTQNIEKLQSSGYQILHQKMTITRKQKHLLIILNRKRIKPRLEQ